MQMVQVKDWGFCYPGCEAPALSHVNFTIEEGAFVLLCGASGSGKSTFLRCINSLEQPTSGEIIVDGHVITEKHANINKIRENIGMVFQQFNLFPHLTALRNITMAPLDRKKMDKATAEPW